MLDPFLALPKPFMIVALAFFSLCIGSFLNVVIYRLSVKHGFARWPAKRSEPNLVWPRSFCTKCYHVLAWFDNLPLLSFLILKGQCRYCHKKISAQYPLVELATMVLSLILFFALGVTPKLAAALLLCWWLIPLFVLDLKFFILPNELTLSLIVVALAINAFHIIVPFNSAVIGVTVGYLSLAILDRLYLWYRKRHGIGQGDWKLLAALGAFFGWQSVLNVITIAAICGTVFGLFLMITKRAHLQSRLPFGVFLALAAYVELLLDAFR